MGSSTCVDGACVRVHMRHVWVVMWLQLTQDCWWSNKSHTNGLYIILSNSPVSLIVYSDLLTHFLSMYMYMYCTVLSGFTNLPQANDETTFAMYTCYVTTLYMYKQLHTS